MKHVELMTARDIIPVKVVELVVTSMEVVNRATADRYSIERYDYYISYHKLYTRPRNITITGHHSIDITGLLIPDNDGIVIKKNLILGWFWQYINS